MTRVFTDYQMLAKGPASVVCLGNFDGIHLGHQLILSAAKSEASRRHMRSILFSFDPHPSRFLRPERMQPKLLLSPREKLELFDLWHFDAHIMQNFTKEFSEIAAEDFIENVLVNHLNTKLLVVGENFRFGFGARGNASLLRASTKFELLTNPLLDSQGQAISSSRVRELVGRGDFELANALLGYSYFLQAKVVAGEGRGRRLGFPTLNLETDRECLPLQGVYAGIALLEDGSEFKAAVNFGINPSFGGTKFKIEAHLLGFKGTYQPNSIRLYLFKRLRDEMKFSSVDELKAQIGRDVLACSQMSLQIKLLKTS